MNFDRISLATVAMHLTTAEEALRLSQAFRKDDFNTSAREHVQACIKVLAADPEGVAALKLFGWKSA
jgi:hypothetical protein